MNRRISWSRCLWRLQTGAFEFYLGGASRAMGAAAGRSLRRRSPARRRSLGGAVMLVLGLPALLWLADAAGSSRVATRTGIIEGRPVGEVTSLAGSLHRYYKEREAGRWVGPLTGREVTINVVVTGYTSRPEETDSTPFITAANTRTRPGVVALSRDLLTRYTAGAPFEFGDIVHISGLGDFLVEDSMASRWERRADIWFEDLGQARSFGRHKLVLTGPYGLAEGQKLSHPTVVASAAAGASR